MYQTIPNKIILGIACLFLSAFLFIGSIPYEGRIWNALWNLGHVVLFAFITALGWHFTVFASIERNKRVLVLLIVCLVLGFFTEWVQLLVAREFSLNDIISDMTGCVFALSWYYFQVRWQRLLAIALIFVFALKSLIIEIYFYSAAHNRWPVLLESRTRGELVHLESDAPVSIDTERERTVINFRKTHYSGFMLRAVKNDWREYTFIKLDIGLPSNSTLQLSCHLNDFHYKLNTADFSDRYNTTINLTLPRQVVSFNLLEASNGLADRKLDLSDMRGVGCYVVEQKNAIVYLHKVWLE